MADLTTLANVKSWLGLSPTGDDALLARLISSASDDIQTFLNRIVGTATYTDIWDGGSTRKNSFFAYPVTAVASVVVDGVPIPPSASPGGSGYVFSRTMLSLIGYSFASGAQNCSVTYTAGFATVPTEIEQSCIELVGLRYKGRDRIGVTSKSANGESVVFSQGDFSAAITDTLRQYKKVHLS